MKSIVVLLLVFMLSFDALGMPTAAATQVVAHTEKIKAEIQKAVAKGKPVNITLLDGSHRKGYVRRKDEMSFDLTDNDGTTSKISYADVHRVSATGLSRGAKIAIIAGSAVAVTAIVFVIGFKRAGY